MVSLLMCRHTTSLYYDTCVFMTIPAVSAACSLLVPVMNYGDISMSSLSSEVVDIIRLLVFECMNQVG